MSKESTRIEAMIEILDSLNISLTEEEISVLVRDFTLHLEMEREIEMTPHIDYKPQCNKCKALEQELKDMTKQRDIYHSNVCKRRNTKDVWIEGETVMYRPE